MDPPPLSHPIPNEWQHAVTALAGMIELDVAGFTERIHLDRAVLERLHLPLLAMLDAMQRASRRRLIAGLAGIPGGGKSTLAASLAWVAERLIPGAFAVVPMDGFHLPNDELDRRRFVDVDGNAVALRSRKGSPASFDVDALLSAMKVLRDAVESVSLPVYDRTVHEPVPGRLVVPPGVRIVLLEGNYLFLDVPPWDRLVGLLKPRIYLDGDAALARERIISRHMRGGIDRAAAERKYEINDSPNTIAVSASMVRADLVVRWGGARSE